MTAILPNQSLGGKARVENSVYRGQHANQFSAQGPSTSPPKWDSHLFIHRPVNFWKETKVWKIVSARMCVWSQWVFLKTWSPWQKLCVIFVPLKNQLINSPPFNRQHLGKLPPGAAGLGAGVRFWRCESSWSAKTQTFQFFFFPPCFWKGKMPSTIWMPFHWFFQENIWL